MSENYKLLCHNSIKITGSKTIYIDPFRVDTEYHDADVVFSTHSHYDHFSEEDIEKVMKDSTVIVTPDSSRELAYGLTKDKEKVFIVEPDQEYEVEEIHFSTTYAYNKEKMYHQKSEGWVGYIIELDGVKYYIAGDTDNLKELGNVSCDIAFLPVGGKYTMDYREAAELANRIEAKVVVPTHYGLIVGERADAEKFKELVVEKEVRIEI
ncbi:MAG: MBL fold metallo-hydrolase [Clostridia bacterium]|nr:MBL fold metallo-hydrolase [Clostridia bacterium]